MAVGVFWLEAKKKSVKQSKNCVAVSAFMVFRFGIAQLQDLFGDFVMEHTCSGSQVHFPASVLSAARAQSMIIILAAL